MGKHYNRCKRLHPLLASGLQTLHFRRFIKDKGALNDNLMQLFIETNSNLSDESISKLEASQEYIDLMEEYEAYSTMTRNGNHGDTACYWMLYIV